MRLEARFGPGEAPPHSAPRTALRLEDGAPRHAEAHRDRLLAGLLAMGDNGAWVEPLLADAWAWARAQAAGAPVLALRIQTDPATHTLHLRLEDLPAVPIPYNLHPRLHPLALERFNPLAPLKGCLGPWNLGVLAEAQAAGAQDALLHWDDGTVAETAIATVGRLEGRSLRLPPAQGRVRSLAELLELPTWADERGWEVTFAPLPLQEALQGQLWCFNALRGLWPAQALRTPR